MADLPSIANRLNDIEISANAPLTESLLRKIGSDINLLLDFLGINNGETQATGVLSDIINAIDLVAGHTLQLQSTLTGPGSVGTYSKIPYVDRVFYNRGFGGISTDGLTSRADGFRRLIKNIDGSGFINFIANRSAPAPTVADNESVNDLTQLNFPNVLGTKSGGILKPGIDEAPPLGSGNPGGSTSVFRGGVNPGIGGSTSYKGLEFGGFESVMRGREWTELGVLSWREFPTDASSIVVNMQEFFNAQIYMAYRFNVESAPLF